MMCENQNILTVKSCKFWKEGVEKQNLQLNWYELFLLSSDTTCRIVIRPNESIRRVLRLNQRRNSLIQSLFSLISQFNVSFIDLLTMYKRWRQSGRASPYHTRSQPHCYLVSLMWPLYIGHMVSLMHTCSQERNYILTIWRNYMLTYKRNHSMTYKQNHD